jgi:MurNAc alpha-1-phosphate uridylyltransferase
MKAMILAAGRGERMRPLTDRIPKPLLEVAGEPLIAHCIRKLVAAGITELVINHAYLGHQIEERLGDGHLFGAQITYSPETEAMETAGGIVQALSHLGPGRFLVVNADIWSDFSFSDLATQVISTSLTGHLIMVPNPAHHAEGDFYLLNGMLDELEGERLTYSGIAVFKPEFFAGLQPGKRPLAPLLRQAIARNQLSAERYEGFWIDVGTPERIQQLQMRLATRD